MDDDAEAFVRATRNAARVKIAIVSGGAMAAREPAPRRRGRAAARARVPRRHRARQAINGRAYLYSPEQRRIVCVGDLDVQNSPSVDVEYSDNLNSPMSKDMSAWEASRAALDRDLEVQLRRQLASHLRATEP